jgi:hypothetical protein
MIRLPMLNVDSWFVGVRDDDERAALSAAPNALLLNSSAEGVFGALIARDDSQRDQINLSESGCVGTKPSSVIPKRSTSDDVEECGAGTSEMFRTYASCRVLSTAIETSTIAYLPTQAERSAGSTPAGRAGRTVEAERRALTPPSTA